MNPNDPKSSQEPSQRSSSSSHNASSQAYSSSEDPKIYTSEPHDTARISDEKAKSRENLSQKEHVYQKQQQHEESMQDKVRDTFRSRQDSKKIDEIYGYAKYNKSQVVTYILLILGLLTLFFNPIVGGLIIGMVAGYYFDAEIAHYIRTIGKIGEGQNQMRYFTLTALLVGLFIEAPSIFIGAALVAAFRQAYKRDTDRYEGPDSKLNGR